MIGDFLLVWQERGLLLAGLANTVVLSTVGTFGALIIGAALSAALIARTTAVAVPARAFVDAMRCVPFLLFAYLVYYGLPSLGLNFDNWNAGLSALTLYHAAYMAEIFRGAQEAQPAAPFEAGKAFGFTGWRMFRQIVLPPLVLAAAPVMGNQAITVVKDSAFLTVIAIPELTHAASSIQSRRYVPFAAFITAVALYWAICLVIEAAVGAVGRVAEERR